MAEWKMGCYDGERFALPTPLAWELNYGLGSPCDSFWVKTLWTPGQEERLAAGTRMQVMEGGGTVFTGVLDECQCQWSQEGCVAEFSGRGMQALLLDNQAGAVDYGQASLGEILRGYVSPYGISLEKEVYLPPVWGFSVGSGSSCWKVLYDFVRYHGAATPRFTREGKLALHPWADGEPVALEAGAPVTRFLWKYQRYGVLSQVTVRDTTGWNPQVVRNAAFQAQGGQCSRVMLLPRKTAYQARRYNAQFQLDRSKARMETVEVTLAMGFAAWPGDLVQLTRPGWSRNGRYRVLESRVRLDGEGLRTTLLLGDPAAVL